MYQKQIPQLNVNKEVSFNKAIMIFVADALKLAEPIKCPIQRANIVYQHETNKAARSPCQITENITPFTSDAHSY